MCATNSKYETEKIQLILNQQVFLVFSFSRAQEHLITDSVAYTASISAKVVTAIPMAGPFNTAIRGLGKSINVSMKSLTKVMLKLNLVI